MDYNLFTYDELQTYCDVINEVKAHTDDVSYYMHGCFPDCECQSGDIDMAVRKAELLARNAEALVNELKSLQASKVL